MNWDHHNGKAVKSVRRAEGQSYITFETGEEISVPGELSPTLVGQSLLAVESGQLIFGYSQPGKPAMRQTEIPTGESEIAAQEEEVKPAKAKPKGSRQSRSKGKRG